MTAPPDMQVVQSNGDIQDANGIQPKQLCLKLRSLLDKLLDTPEGTANADLAALSLKIRAD
eukprot:COSAG01_NODE_11731_length_1870_cov_7.682101_2_plen_61_part_00